MFLFLIYLCRRQRYEKNHILYSILRKKYPKYPYLQDFQVPAKILSPIKKECENVVKVVKVKMVKMNFGLGHLDHYI